MKTCPPQIFTLILFVSGLCLLAEGQQIIPGIYGDEEWQKNRQFDMSADSFWVVVANRKNTNNGCFQDVSIGGKGVFDIVKLECTTIPIVYADKYEMIVGNRVYSVNDGSLIFFNQDNTCVKKSYFMNQLNQLNHVDSYLNAAECTDIRRKMKQVLTEIGHDIIGEQSPLWRKYLGKLDQAFSDLGSSSSGSSDKPSYNPSLEPHGTVMGWFITSSTPFLLANGKSAKVVHIKPPGNDTTGEQFLIPATENTGLKMSGEVAFIGSSFFSATPNTLVILSGDRCILRKYSKASTISEDITGGEPCQMIRSAMIRQTGKAGSNVVIIGGNNQKAQADQATSQKPQSNQSSQNNQKPQSNDSSQNQKPQSNQATQNNQKPQSNQTSQNNRVTQRLIRVTEALMEVVNKLANNFSVSGQPYQLLSSIGEALSRIAAHLRTSQE